MAKCEHCVNDYDKTFEISRDGKTHTFDSFEFAIHVMAPQCSHCGCRIIGHGVEGSGKYFAVLTTPPKAAMAGCVTVADPI